PIRRRSSTSAELRRGKQTAATPLKPVLTRLRFFPQQSPGEGVPRLRSVDQSPVASAFAFFTAFLVLWPAVFAPSFVFSPMVSTVSLVFLPTVSAVSFVFSPTVSAASLVFSPALSSPSLLVSPAFFPPCSTSFRVRSFSQLSSP